MGCTLSRQLLACANLASSVAASLLGAGGAAISVWSVSGFAKATAGLGAGAQGMDETATAATALAVSLVILNILGAGVVCASTFDCGATTAWSPEKGVVQSLTSSRSLWFGHVAIGVASLAQILLTQLVLIAVVAVSALLYVCHAGAQVQYNSQQLLNEIVNQINAPAYDELGMPIARIPDTPIVSMRDLVVGLDMKEFCISGEGSGEKAIAFYVGCLLVSVAQMMMAAAFWGEAQRVAVHESHERHLANSVTKYSQGGVGSPVLPHVRHGRYLQDACSNSSSGYPYVPAVEATSNSRSEHRSLVHSVAMNDFHQGYYHADETHVGDPRYSLDFRERDGKVEYF